MTEFNWEEACELSDKLSQYAAYEDNEHGEMVTNLVNLAGYPDYMSEKLWNAVVAAMKAELKNYEKNAKIVTTEETFTREVSDLVWNDEVL